MLRQSSSRNQRSKGSEVKYGLRICLLLAVCFWLIFQVKHSHENAKQFDEDEANDTLDGGLIKLGRKDIHSQVSKYENHDESLEEEGVVSEEEIEEIKHEEDSLESEDEDEDGDGDDKLKKLDAGVEREEDFLVDEEEREDDAENETEEKHVEDVRSQKALEKLFRGDNASSEVSTTHKDIIEMKKVHVDTFDHPESILQSWNKENKSEGNKNFDNRENSEERSDGGIAKDDKLSIKIGSGRNVTAGETMEIISKGSSPQNKTIEGIPRDNPDTRKSLTEGDAALNVFEDGNNLQTIALESNKNFSILHGENNLSGSHPSLDKVTAAEDSQGVGTSIKHATESNTPDPEKSYASNGRDETMESTRIQNSEA